MRQTDIFPSVKKVIPGSDKESLVIKEMVGLTFHDDFASEAKLLKEKLVNLYSLEVFKQRLEERFGKYGLELAEEKTKILEFGRFARRNRKARGERKPDTFDFLGFTFYCGTDGECGRS